MKSWLISDNRVIDLDQIVRLEVLLPKVKSRTLESLRSLAKKIRLNGRFGFAINHAEKFMIEF